jgi:hypothetical protein
MDEPAVALPWLLNAHKKVGAYHMTGLKRLGVTRLRFQSTAHELYAVKVTSQIHDC